MDVLQTLQALFRQQQVHVIDSMPLPACRWVRRNQCRKVQGKAYQDYSGVKSRRFFGWKLHLVYNTEGIPVNFEVLPATWHDLTPIHELTVELPASAIIPGDKAYNSTRIETVCYHDDRKLLIPKRRKNMIGKNAKGFSNLLKQYHSRIETLYSQLEKIGVQRLHARTTADFCAKL